MWRPRKWREVWRQKTHPSKRPRGIKPVSDDEDIYEKVAVIAVGLYLKKRDKK